MRRILVRMSCAMVVAAATAACGASLTGPSNPGDGASTAAPRTSPRAAPPTRAALGDRASALGFGAHTAAIQRDALPGARLVAGGSAAPGATRLGGRPDLPPDMAWPRCKGRRLSFLAQLRVADLAAIAPAAVPSNADILLVFGDLSSRKDGITRIELAAGPVGAATCVVVRTVRGALERRRVPAGVATLRSTPVRLRPTLTVPDDGIATARYHLARSDRAFLNWLELEAEAASGSLGHGWDKPVHQVLGWPQPVQDTPLYGCGRRPPKGPSYRLLLQLDFDVPLRFDVGDGGVLYISGRADDMRAGRFDRLCTEFQEG